MSPTYRVQNVGRVPGLDSFATPSLLLSYPGGVMKGHIRKRGDAWELRVCVGVDAGVPGRQGASACYRHA